MDEAQVLLAEVVSDLLGEQDVGILTALLSEIHYRPMKRGEVLIQPGEDSDRIFVVVSGRLRIVSKDPEGKETLVDELSRGDTLGEKNLLAGDIPCPFVYALQDSAVGVITRQIFENIKFQYPEVITRLTQIAYRRVQAYIARRTGTSIVTVGVPLTSHAASIAVVPVGGHRGSVPISAFTEQFVSALSPIWGCLHLNSARVDELLGIPGIAEIDSQHPSDQRLSAWLREQEQGHYCVIYEADDGWSPWTERCLCLSDRYLLVGRGDLAPETTGIDEPLKRLTNSLMAFLVLLQPDSISQPSGTAAWLDHFEIGRHDHVRLGNPKDVEGFMRRITGRGLGLVLGGGGARGFAHLGVFRALEECGVDVDIVGGTSIGAVLGAMFAMGLGYEGTREFARQMASPIKLFDPTMPVVSFFSSGKVSQVLERICGDRQIEDLWTPFFCVSSNLTHAVAVVHRRGPLWRAVRASMAIPGIFSPVLSGNDLLVDGCVLDNLPIDVMQRMNFSGPIIAVNVFPDEDLVRHYDFGSSVSGWRALANKLNPLRRAESPPMIFESLVRVLALNSVHQVQTQRGFADVYIRPPVEEFNILDFGAYQQIANIGYESAMEALGEWEALPKQKTRQAKSSTRGRLTSQLDLTLAELEELLEEMENIKSPSKEI